MCKFFGFLTHTVSEVSGHFHRLAWFKKVFNKCCIFTLLPSNKYCDQLEHNFRNQGLIDTLAHHLLDGIAPHSFINMDLNHIISAQCVYQTTNLL